MWHCLTAGGLIALAAVLGVVYVVRQHSAAAPPVVVPQAPRARERASRRPSLASEAPSPVSSQAPPLDGVDAVLAEMRRLAEMREAAVPDDPDHVAHAAALAEMLLVTRYRNLVFTRSDDDQTIAYVEQQFFGPPPEERTVGRYVTGRGFLGPDGEVAEFFGFHDLIEPYGTIVLRVDGQETVLHFRALPDAGAP